jgi:hypothetical protein
MPDLLALANAPPQRRIGLAALLGCTSALLSNYVIIGPEFNILNVPALPGIFFGAALGILIFALTRNAFDAVVVLILTVVAWFFARKAAEGVFVYVQQQIVNPPGALFKYGNMPAYSLGLCGLVGGFVGSTLVALAIASVRQEFRTFENWARVVLFGTAAGMLAECIPPMWGYPATLPIHIESGLPLFLVWQCGIAGFVAIGTSPRLVAAESLPRFKTSLPKFDFLTSPLPASVAAGPAKTQAPTAHHRTPMPKGTKSMTTGPTPQTAYILNIILPGAGNIYFGQPIIGTIFILAILLGLFMLFLGASAAMLGIVIILVSVVAAFFTLGISLLIGLPIGLIFLMMGAGPIVAFIIWMFSLVVSELLIHSKASKQVAQS